MWIPSFLQLMHPFLLQRSPVSLTPEETVSDVWEGAQDVRLCLTNCSEDTVWRRDPSHCPQAAASTPKSPGWAVGCAGQALGKFHGPAVFPGTALAAGLGLWGSVCQRNTQHSTDLCVLQNYRTQKAEPCLNMCMLALPPRSLIVFPKIPEQQSRWKPYLNLETVNTTCWAQCSNSSCFPLNVFFFF